MSQTHYFDQHVFCCVNEREAVHPRGCCKAKGSEAIRDYLKMRTKALGLKNTRINAAGCLDRCELGPTLVIYPEGAWYHCPTIEDAEAIIQSHLAKGEPLARLLLDTKQKRLPPLC